MHIGESIRIGITEIRMHKMRSLLTMMGVIFGIAAVIATSAIGAGAREELNRQLAELGTNTVRLRAVAVEGADAVEALKRSPYGLTRADVASLARIESIVEAAPIKKSHARAYVDGRTLSADVVGTTSALPGIVGYRLAEGRFLSPVDNDTAAMVAVIGDDVRRRVFPAEDPLGKQIVIASQYYTVIGVMEGRGSSGNTVIEVGNIDRQIFIPLNTLYSRLGTLSDPRADRLDEIVLKVSTERYLRETSRLVERMLTRRHQAVPDFEVLVPEELIRQQQETESILSNVLLFVAAISLIVGGIGIMNIMLATVTQRTREIGVRRALGATRSDILGQFIIESLIISLLGGIMGIGLGYGLAYGIKVYAAWSMIVPISSVIVSTIVSGGIGFLFGLYPSMKAARLDPIEALRTE